VIDTRCKETGGRAELPRDPIGRFYASETIKFMPHPMNDLDPEAAMVKDRVPRIWFFEKANARSRASVVKRMEERFTDPTRAPAPYQLAAFIGEQAGEDVKLLDALNLTWVYPFVAWPKGASGLTKGAAPTSGAGTGRLPLDQSEMAGFDTMRDALAAALKDQADRRSRFRTKTKPKPKPAAKKTPRAKKPAGKPKPGSRR
jgi:hypothetical protein